MVVRTPRSSDSVCNSELLSCSLRTVRLKVLLRRITLLRFFLLTTHHTRGFKSRLHRADHFKKHRQRLRLPEGELYERIYERIADGFLGRPLNPTSQEFVRPWNNDLFRYDIKHDVVGLMDRNIYIKTYFRPHPSEHGFATNRAYFDSERAKT